MAKYNGHKNRNHWNVSLWIGNDEGLYRAALYFMRRYGNKNDAARMLLACLPEKTPDGVRYSFTTVRAALAGLA